MLLDRVSRIAHKGRTHVGKLVRARPHLGHHALGRNREVRGKLASAHERMSSRNTFGIALGSPKVRARDRGGSRIGEPAVVIILTFSLRLLDREFGIREDVVEHQHGERGLSAMDRGGLTFSQRLHVLAVRTDPNTLDLAKTARQVILTGRLFSRCEPACAAGSHAHHPIRRDSGR